MTAALAVVGLPSVAHAADGAADTLVFTQQPGDGAPGVDLATQPEVVLQDAEGNPVAADSTIRLTLDTLTPRDSRSDGVLACDSDRVALDEGVATFTGCAVDRGGSYTITATDVADPSMSVTSEEFAVSGPAELVFTVQPGGGSAGAAWANQPQVTVRDALGDTVTESTASIGIVIAPGSGAEGGWLTCADEVAVEDGVARFDGCSVGLAGAGYTLLAYDVDDRLVSAPSDPFDVTGGPASALSFTTQPGGVGEDGTLATQPVVAVTDLGGNAVPGSSDTVTLAITPGTGTDGAALTCDSGTVQASGGVATFAGCRVDVAGTGYTLTATDPQRDLEATSAPFDVVSGENGDPARLRFVISPDGGTGGEAWSAQPIVAIEDAAGSRITSSTAEIELSVTPGTGSGTLTCNDVALPATEGAAQFSGCTIDKTGSGYTLTARSGDLTAVSAAFAVEVGPPAQLVLGAQPGDTRPDEPFDPQPVVTVADAGGNAVRSSDATVLLSLAPGTGAEGALLSCAGSAPVLNGYARFRGCSIDLAAGGYVLTATDPADGLAVESLPLSVVPAPPVPLEQAPTGVPAGQTFGSGSLGVNPTNVSDRVNTATGSLTFTETDLTVAGVGLPLVLARTYNSADTSPSAAFGTGWSSILDLGVTVGRDGRTATVRGEDGQLLVFTRTRRAGPWTAPPGARADLRCTATTCTVTRFDGVSWQVRNGRLVEYRAPGGHGLTFDHVKGGITITVETVDPSTPLEVDVALDDAGRVTAVATPTRTTRYGYTDGLLTSYTDPRGETWTYRYSAGLLTRVTDPIGADRLRATYGDDHRVTAVSIEGSAAHADVELSWDPDTQTATRRALVDVAGTPLRVSYQDRYRDNVLVAQTFPWGATMRYSYDERVNLVAVQDPAGWVQQMGYDDEDNLTSQSTPLDGESSAVVRMTYDWQHRLTSETDALGNSTRYVYTGPWLGIVRPPAGAQAQTRYRYDNHGLLTSMTTPTSLERYTYDDAGNVRTVVLLDAKGRVATNGEGALRTYDEAGNLVTSIDPRGTTTGPADHFETTWAYDADGNLLSTTPPGGTTTTQTYDAAGDLVRVDDADGTTTYRWDEPTLTQTVTSPAGTATRTFDASGDLLAETDVGNRTTTHRFDRHGREVATTDPANLTAAFTYDAIGNVVRATDTGGNVLDRAYDGLNRIVREVTNGEATYTEYDLASNVTAITDSTGASTTWSYTGQGTVASVSDVLGTTSYAYDRSDRVTTVTDPNGHHTNYSYDPAGRVVSTTVARSATAYAYDVAGNLVSMTDPDGRLTSYTLDNQNRPLVTRYSWPGHPGDGTEVEQTFDQAGRRTSVTDPSGTRSFDYDDSGNLIRYVSGSGTFTYDFDQPGSIVETYPDGTRITYAVDDAQNLMSVEAEAPDGGSGDGQVGISYIRDADRRTIGLAFANGVLETRQLDEKTGTILDQTIQYTDTVLSHATVTYDALGNPVSQTRTVGGTTTTQAYGYDTVGRITGYASSTSAADAEAVDASVTLDTTVAEAPVVTAAAARGASGTPSVVPPFRPDGHPQAVSTSPVAATAAPAYTYDAVGNRLTARDQQGTTTYTYDEADRLVSESGPDGLTRRGYDRSGNLVEVQGPGTSQELSYDAAGRLVEVTSTSQGTTTTVGYGYDGDGRRVTRTVDGTTTHSVWDPIWPHGQIALERTDAGALVRRYVYGDGPVALQTPDATFYYHRDALGNVALLSDADGAVAAVYEYDPFGDVTTTGAQAPANPLLFQSLFLDADTGLYDLRARDYDPGTGRFVQCEPLAEAVGVPAVSPYVYVGNRPTVLADPSGEFGEQSYDWSDFKIYDRWEAAATDSVTGTVTEIAVGYFDRPTTTGVLLRGEKLGLIVTKATVSLVGKVGKYTSAFEAALEPGGTWTKAAKAGKALKNLGRGLTVLSIGLDAYFAYEDCRYGTPADCAGSCVGLYLNVAMTVTCDVVSAGSGSVLCSVLGMALSMGAKYLISTLFADEVNATYDVAEEWATTAGTEAWKFTKDTGEAIESGFNDAVSSVSSGFDEAIGTLVEAGYEAAELAELLATTFDESISDVTQALEGFGYDVADLAVALGDVFSQSAQEAALYLTYTFDYSAAQVAALLHSAYYDLGPEAAAEILRLADHTVSEIAEALDTAYDLAAERVAEALQIAGFAADEVANALKSVYGLSAEAVAEALRYADYALDEVADALGDAYDLTTRGIADALSAIGIDDDLISSLGGGFSSFFSDAGSFLDDLFSF